MMRTLSAMVILLLLLLSALSIPAAAAGGSGGADGAGAGGSDGAGNSDDSAGDGAAPSEGPQAQPLQEEQERKQQTTVEQPGVQINQQDRDQTQSRTNVSTDDESIILQRDRDLFLQQVGMRQQNLSGEPERAQVALYALSIAGNVTGRGGTELARLGAEVNTSFTAAYAAEEQIKNQNSLMRMLYGGDREAAGLLVQYADQNRQRIQTMEQLIANCSDCDPQVRLMLEEQVQVLSQEQNRLITLGQEEQADKGLFGWLF